MKSVNIKICYIESAEIGRDIERVLKTSTGIEDIMIDEKTGIASIQYIPKLISVEDMERTIYEIGYDVSHS